MNYSKNGFCTAKKHSDCENFQLTSDKYYFFKNEMHKEVKGKPISLHGLPNQDFFIHKDGSRYVIAEGHTGLLVGCGTTRAIALMDAYECIKKAGGYEKINSYIQKSIEIGILSPRYQEQKSLGKRS